MPSWHGVALRHPLPTQASNKPVIFRSNCHAKSPSAWAILAPDPEPSDLPRALPHFPLSLPSVAFSPNPAPVLLLPSPKIVSVMSGAMQGNLKGIFRSASHGLMERWLCLHMGMLGTGRRRRPGSPGGSLVGLGPQPRQPVPEPLQCLHDCHTGT